MAELDIFKPQISVVAKGLEGKVITIYGGNNLGKTKQSSRMKKPLYLPLEKGLNAISGVPFMPVNNWSDFKKVTRQLYKNKEKAKEVYQTIIIDSVDSFAKYATRYICNKYGVERLKDGNDGFGLWQEYATEVWEEVDKLVSLGMTIIFIAHVEEDKNGKRYPKGDKRTIAPILDNSDIVVYLHTNGVDENGKVIKSSGYLAETNEYFARSRFDYIDTVIPKFTAENLEKAIIEAIKRQEEAEGVEAVSYDEQVSIYTSDKVDFETLKENTINLLNQLASNGKHNPEDLVEIVEKYLGKGNKVTEAKPRQYEGLAVLFDELQDLVE